MSKSDKYVVLNDNLLVELLPKEEQLVSGIYVGEPEGVEKYIRAGTVLKTGPGKLSADGLTIVPLTAKVGQTIYLNTKAAIRFLPNMTEEYFVVAEKDVYCLVAENIDV